MIEFGPEGLRAVPDEGAEETIPWKAIRHIESIEAHWNSVLRIQLRDGDREYRHDARLFRILLHLLESWLVETPLAGLCLYDSVPPAFYLHFPTPRLIESRRIGVEDLFGVTLDLEPGREECPVRVLFKQILTRLVVTNQAGEFEESPPEPKSPTEEGYGGPRTRITYIDSRGVIMERVVVPPPMSDFTHLTSVSAGLPLQNHGGAIGEMSVKIGDSVRRLSVRIWPEQARMKVTPVRG